MKQKSSKPSSHRTSSDIPPEELDLFLDTHGWKTEPAEVREKVREHIVHLYLTSMLSPKILSSEVRQKLKDLQSALTKAADQLSIKNYVDFEAFQAISREDPEFRCPSLGENLRRLANLCNDAWLSSENMEGGDYRDINARRFANNCYHFLKKCHPKSKVTKKLLKEFTPDLYEFFKFGENPGLQRACDDVWAAHKRYNAGQDPYITSDGGWHFDRTGPCWRGEQGR